MFGWWSHWRIYLSLCGGLGIASTCICVCYLLWLAQGCMPFLPFISDFAGGDSCALFKWGLTIAAILLMPSFVDYHMAIKASIVGKSRFCQIMSKLTVVFGIVVCVSLIGVAQTPWSRDLKNHVLWSSGIFYGGGACMLTDIVVSNARGVGFVKQACAAAIVLLGSWAIGVCIRGGIESMAKADQELDFAMLETNFQMYCTGGSDAGNVSLHGYYHFNVAAMIEWLVIGSLILSSLERMYLELHNGLPLSAWKAGTPLLENAFTADDLLMVH